MENWIIQNRLLVSSGVFILGLAVLLFCYLRLNKKVKTLFGGHESTNETIQQDMVRRLTKTEIKLEELEPRLEIVEAISHMSIQKVGFTRFNPFENTGGDNSFIIAFLDRGNNGIILSSLYTREGVRVYAKNIEKGRPKNPLSEEEAKILENTINK